MLDDAELCYTSATELLAAYGTGTTSPVEVVDALLARIERLDPSLHAYVRIDAVAARAAARRSADAWREGRAGPLEGVPVAVKDVFASGRTTAGSRLLADHEPATEAVAVARLRAAGAVVMGKTATYEFAFGRPSGESFHPPARNPWDTTRDPGGSSSGSGVAVAAGLAHTALGTDTSGSVRWPAALCGAVGLKPTYGLIPRTGVIPLAWSLDHVGPITRTVADAALLVAQMAGADPGDLASVRRADRGSATTSGTADAPGVSGLRVGIPEDLFSTSCDPAIGALFEDATRVLEALGVELRGVPSITMRQALAITYPLLLAEAASFHASDLRARFDEYSRDLRVFFGAGLLVDGHYYLRCQRVRAQVRAQQLAQLAEVDAFALPTLGFTADPITDVPEGLTFLSGEEFGAYTMVFDLSGLPAISVPCGFTPQGLPAGLQIAAAPFAESVVLRLAEAYERETGWSRHRPPVEGLAA